MKTLSWLVTLALAPAITEMANFDTSTYGKTPSGWITVATRPGAPPAWKVIKDSTAPTPPYVLAHVPGEAPSHFPMVVLDKSDSRDGEISVKFKPVGASGERKAGLVWRYRDENNYYFVRADAQNKNVIMYRVENGTPVALAPRGRPAHEYAVKHNVDADSWSILKVVYKGPRLTVYYDHRRILQVEDPSFTGPGKVGLWTRAASTTLFDNFRLVRK
ncbi:MAG TPA: hypothetical protein VN442_23140 [Bryobacteraceae bacterium]|nr:hypothetical protein [Bryobacteraceae bacterium]